MSFVNSTTTFTTEVDSQFHATFVHARMRLGGTMCDQQFVLGKKEIQSVRAATDFSA